MPFILISLLAPRCFESGSIQWALQRLSLSLNFSLDQMGTSKVGLVIISIVYAFARVEELSQVHELEFIFDKSKPTLMHSREMQVLGLWG